MLSIVPWPSGKISKEMDVESARTKLSFSALPFRSPRRQPQGNRRGPRSPVVHSSAQRSWSETVDLSCFLKGPTPQQQCKRSSQDHWRCSGNKVAAARPQTGKGFECFISHGGSLIHCAVQTRADLCAQKLSVWTYDFNHSDSGPNPASLHFLDALWLHTAKCSPTSPYRAPPPFFRPTKQPSTPGSNPLPRDPLVLQQIADLGLVYDEALAGAATALALRRGQDSESRAATSPGRASVPAGPILRPTEPQCSRKTAPQ